MKAFSLLSAIAAYTAAQNVSTVDQLYSAVDNGSEGVTIEVAAGTYELTKTLQLKSGMTIVGAGMEKTILTNAPSWKPSTEMLPDKELERESVDQTAYMFVVSADDITISDLVVKAPDLHGAVFGMNMAGLTIRNVRIEEVLYSGIRTFGMKGCNITDNDFIDAGGRWQDGERGRIGNGQGMSGGAIYATWFSDCDISNNVMSATKTGDGHDHYGIKGRQAVNVRIHHNSIRTTGFSIELPFELDEDNEIDHNVLEGTVSIPKYEGGPVPESGVTFHIHHNYFGTTSPDGIELVRNGVEVDHNLFDIPLDKDHGHILGGHGQTTAQGPFSFHDNLVSNPAHSLLYASDGLENVSFYNNEVIANPGSQNLKDGLFNFGKDSDLSTIEIRNNIIECVGNRRPLGRNDKDRTVVIENNKLVGVSDTDKYENPQTGEKQGLTEPLKFKCGAYEELQVDGWNAT